MEATLLNRIRLKEEASAIRHDTISEIFCQQRVLAKYFELGSEGMCFAWKNFPTKH